MSPHPHRRRWTSALATLTVAASMLVTTPASATRSDPRPPVTVVSTVADPGYTESAGWFASSLAGFGGEQTRYGRIPGSTASWTLVAPKGGSYAVDVWYPPFHTSASNAGYTISPGGLSVTVDQREGGGYWRPLGRVRAGDGQALTVTLTVGPDLTPANLDDEYARGYAVRLRQGGPANPPTWRGPNLAGYDLAFADEFDGPGIDWTVWDPRTDVRGNSSQRAENVRLADGALVIDLKKESDRGKAYTGGGLVSKDRYRYGYYETRVRINEGPGWHPAFWSMCGGANGVHNCQLAEIDGFEIDSINPRRVIHNVFDHRAPRRQVTSGWYDVGADLSQGWHTFGYLYDEAGVRFFVDGRQTSYLPYPAGPFVHDYMKVWLTAVAYNDFPDDAQLPATVTFDYFRYYTRDVYGDNNAPNGYAETGTGWGDSGLPGFGALTPRQSCGLGATATWTLRPEGTGTGEYDAYLYRVGGTGGQSTARVTFNGAESTVDLSVPGSGWLPLGAHSLVAGQDYPLALARDGAGCIRADAVKLVRR
ncbi:family 16 glycosylhydrolase [Micromonospora sp. CA-259024]|uniref:golvesin C-terminal-like domain-containing protein n=1 Tax=Micromonospora sp. CA-259024 TaxID=3239965 RepID=UPI003D8CD292